jgi:hypothetical protein
MAARSNRKGGRVAGAARAARRARAQVDRSVRRLEAQLPPTLAQFTKQVRGCLGQLETRIEKAGAPYRRRWTRLLREASHRLGRFEAEGEARWQRLTDVARRDALGVLRRLEKEVAPVARRRPAQRSGGRRSSGKRSPSPAV